MAYSSMWTYVWDLVDEGIEPTLDLLKDRIGLSGISVATSYHTVDHLRLHCPKPIYFRARQAALYFVPQASLYKATKIVPNVAPIAKKNNPLAAIAKGCAKCKLDLNSWTVLMHNSHLAGKYPDCAAEDCFGARSPVALCPSNVNVREYFRAVVRDLVTNYGVKNVELESCGYENFRHYHMHEKHGIVFGALDKFALTLCFCESCRARAKKANVDADHVRNQTRKALESAFRRGQPMRGTVEEFVEETSEMGNYVEMREQSMLQFLGELKKAAGKASLITMNEGNRFVTGVGMREMAEVADRVLLLCYSPKPQVVRELVEDGIEAVGKASRLVAGYHCYAPNAPDADTLEATVAAAYDLKVRHFNFYNYGIMPIPNLMWVKDVVAGLK